MDKSKVDINQVQDFYWPDVRLPSARYNACIDHARMLLYLCKADINQVQDFHHAARCKVAISEMQRFHGQDARLLLAKCKTGFSQAPGFDQPVTEL